MYKIETHLHTKEVSGCAELTASEQIQECAKKGYHTVFVTDHYAKGNFSKLANLSWIEKVNMFCVGYMNALKTGKDIGINVLLGIELTFTSTPNDYLVYGITKEFLEEYPELYNSRIEEFYPLAKSLGLFVVQAHPFRRNICYPTPKYVDALEIYNSNPRHEDYNERAKALAREEGLLVTSGSDAHIWGDVGLGGMLSPKNIQTSADYIALIKSGKGIVFKGEHFDVFYQ